MAYTEPTGAATDGHRAFSPASHDLTALEAENRVLRDEIRVSREAAEITARLVVEQFEKSEAILGRLQQSNVLTETALRENKGIMDNASFGICFTRDRKMARYNKAFGEMFGFPGESGIGQPGRVLYPSDAAYAEVGRTAAVLLAQNQPFEHEMLLRRQDGRDFWAYVNGYVADPGDPSMGTVWIIQDRTSFKAVEAEIEKSSQEMAAIFESSTFGIAFIKDRVMIKANGRLEALFGYAQGELCGQPTRCWYPDEESYQAVGLAYRDLENGQTHRRVMKLRRKDGSLFWSRLSGSALSADLSRGSVWTVEDITTEYEATAAMQRAKEAAEAAEEKLRDSYIELEAANERLQKLDQLKSDFLSSVSHELRTPLTSIRGFSQLIEREFMRSFAPLVGENPGLQKKSARIQENLKIILKESERLTRLINDVLDLAKIEAGRTDWHDVPIQVAAFMQDVANAAHGMFGQKPDVELRLDIEQDLPQFIGDADRMIQVLVNLLNNAVKFTDAGAVTVKAFLNPEQLIQIEVHDTGIGFAPEDAEAIFDKFQQAKHGDTLQDRPKGTGLGLAICREIVNRHGGQVWARSQPGQGSVFALTLPPALADAVNTPESTISIKETAGEVHGCATSSGRSGKPRVLVVDDDTDVCGYFTQLLEEQGYEVTSAADGRAAVAAAKRHPPDLITMDLAMPVMDGHAAIALLRADPVLRHIPIMVISALPGWDSAGGDAAMSKPLDESRFVQNIRRLLNNASHNASGGHSGGEPVRFLVLYEAGAGQPPAMTPAGFSACCEVGFCPINELSARIQAGFEGMVVIPADLLNRVDIGYLNAAPSLEVMIMPVAAMGANAAAMQAVLRRTGIE